MKQQLMEIGTFEFPYIDYHIRVWVEDVSEEVIRVWIRDEANERAPMVDVVPFVGNAAKLFRLKYETDIEGAAAWTITRIIALAN